MPYGQVESDREVLWRQQAAQRRMSEPFYTGQLAAFSGQIQHPTASSPHLFSDMVEPDFGITNVTGAGPLPPPVIESWRFGGNMAYVYVQLILHALIPHANSDDSDPADNLSHGRALGYVAHRHF